MKHEDDIELTLQKLKWLRLPGMARTLKTLLDKAAKENLTTSDVIGRLCDEEKASRMNSAIAAKVKGARFPEINTVDGFDFDFDPVRKKLKARYLALHDATFLEKGINPLFIGTPGTGKTYLARALAWRVCQVNKRVVVVSAPRLLNELHGAELHGGLERVMRKYVKADLLVIDDFAVLAMDAAQAKLAFQVISERYDHRRSTCITTNRVFKDWTKVFPDALNAQVIAERLTERSERFILDGKGFR
jgi:DNA replication protein DnaC